MIMPVVLAVASASTRDLVYDARYYYQGSRKSYHQIYLCRHDGTKRIQITNNVFDSAAPMWIDKTHIAYFVKSPYSDGLNFPGIGCKVKAFVYDVISGKSKKIGGFQASSQGWVLSSIGNLLTAHLPGRGDPGLTVRFLVSPTKMKQVSGDDVLKLNPELEDYIKGVLPFKWQSGIWSFSWSVNNSGGFGKEPSITFKSGNSSSRLRGNTADRAILLKDGAGIVITKLINQSNEVSYCLYKFSDKNTKSNLISSELEVVDVNRSTLMWSGIQNYSNVRRTGKLNNGVRVSVNRLVAGTLNGRKMSKVATGLVHVKSSQLRP